MKLTSKVLFLCGALFVQVYASSLESRDASEAADSDNDNRGLIDLVLGRPINNPNQQQLVIPPPLIPEQAPLAPTIPVLPIENPQVQRPGLLNSLNNHIDHLLGGNKDSLFDGLNIDWIRNALSKCAKVDPRQLTAIMPTTTNQLREPRMYYFENSTTNAKTWTDAQQWCSKNGMQLATVNDINENRVLIEKMKQILSGATAGDANNAFWIGLNKRLQADTTWTYVGDSSSTFLDWHTAGPVEPDAATDLCVAMAQRTSADNIHFDAKTCTGTFRYVCEVSEACVSLLMSRYRTHYHIVPQAVPVSHPILPLNLLG